MGNLSGKVAMVTGASSGLGARFAIILAAAGAKVALCARRTDRMAALEAEIKSQGGIAARYTMDVTDVAALPNLLDRIEQDLGPVDILVNNAGMNQNKRLDAYLPEDFDAVMNTNVKGAFFCALEVGKRMIARKSGGRIINIASIGALNPLPGLTAYCMSKAAIAMMTRSLARDWSRHLINVNAICPGFIVTEINDDWFATEKGQAQIASYPRKRVGMPEDLDGTLLLLASDESRFINGALFTVDDGQSIA